MRDTHGRFMPGHPQSSNGRPPLGQALSEVLARYLEMPVAEVVALSKNPEASDLPARDWLAITTIVASLDLEHGDKDRRYAFDRVDGRPRQALEIGVPAADQRVLAAKLLAEELRLSREARASGLESF